jgi:hypothetical protein
MRYFRRLPPFMRVVSALGLLFPVAALLLLLLAKLYWSPFHAPSADFGRSVRSGVIALYLITLGVACSLVVAAYNTRVRQPGRRRRVQLDSWQSQTWALALAVVGPLCGFIVTLANSPSFIGTDTSFTINVVAICWPLAVMGLLALP